MPVPRDEKGVYAVALPKALKKCPISTSALEELLDARKELTLDGERPDVNMLDRRLAAFWLPDEVVLYVGLAGTSLRKRVGQYYRTRLGARSPHAGGWFLKVLSVLPELEIHYATCADPRSCEERMLGSFSAKVSDRTQTALYDPELPIPFANLEWPRRRVKRHGIKGAKEPRRRTA